MRTIEELRIQNEALERSPKYQRILPEVMREVYTIFVNNRIDDYERFYANQKESEDIYKDEDNPVMIEFFKNMQADLKARREEEKKKIEEAKQLLPTYPERAAELFIQLGSCHTLWAIQKHILKEKNSINLFTPSTMRA